MCPRRICLGCSVPWTMRPFHGSLDEASFGRCVPDRCVPPWTALRYIFVVGKHRSGARWQRDASSKEHVIQGTGLPRDASSKGRIVKGTEHPRLFVRVHSDRGRNIMNFKKHCIFFCYRTIEYLIGLKTSDYRISNKKVSGCPGLSVLHSYNNSSNNRRD